MFCFFFKCFLFFFPPSGETGLTCFSCMLLFILPFLKGIVLIEDFKANRLCL